MTWQACYRCNGTGKVLQPTAVDFYHTAVCPACEGTGCFWKPDEARPTPRPKDLKYGPREYKSERGRRRVKVLAC